MLNVRPVAFLILLCTIGRGLAGQSRGGQTWDEMYVLAGMEGVTVHVLICANHGS